MEAVSGFAALARYEAVGAIARYCGEGRVPREDAPCKRPIAPAAVAGAADVPAGAGPLTGSRCGL